MSKCTCFFPSFFSSKWQSQSNASVFHPVRLSFKLLPFLSLFPLGAGTLVLGAPLWIVPFPLVAAAGIVQFYYSSALRDYLVFAGAHLVAVVWFIWKHFLVLDVQFGDDQRNSSHAVVDLQSVCLQLIVLNGCILLLPALLLVKSASGNSGRQLNYPNMTGFVTALIVMGVAKVIVKRRVRTDEGGGKKNF